MRTLLKLTRTRWIITTAMLCHQLVTPRLVTSQLLPAVSSNENGASSQRPSVPVTIDADYQEKQGAIYKLRGNIKIDYGTYTITGDEGTYNSDTGDVEADGHLVIDGGPNDEHIEATRGKYNLESEKGTFEHVTGSIGFKIKQNRAILTTTNPFFFTGKVVVKDGPNRYIVTDGRVTTCELPHPKWQFYANKVDVEVGGSAKIYYTDFRIEGIPIFYFPFATHPVQRRPRQTGFLIPSATRSSIRGYTVGDAFFWAINRSMDLLAGTDYYSLRGWAPRAEFRIQPTENSFADLNYFSVFDRGVDGVKQGGTEVRLDSAAPLGADLRAVANVDYLSSYVFRLVFSDAFSQAINSEVKSDIFVSKTTNDLFLNAVTSRYQDFLSDSSNAQVISILHAPGVEASSVDRRLGETPIYGNFDFSAEGLSRKEPLELLGNGSEVRPFSTDPYLLGRLDLSPTVSLPLTYEGWDIRPSLSLRDTFYTQQLAPVAGGSTNGTGTALSNALNRRSLETSLELRPPPIEKVFDHEFLGRKWKHVIEPRLVYDYVTGVDNFAKILRFDERDILSDTNEVEYAIVNRLYAKRTSAAPEKCAKGMPALMVGEAPPPTYIPWQRSNANAERSCPPEPTIREIVTWELAQKYFFDPTFGGALVPGKSNVLTSTADLTGIAFLSEPTHLSPLISRLRVSTGSRNDFEWDADYDFEFGRVNTSTVLFNQHLGLFTFGAGDAFLHVPGQASSIPGAVTPASEFNQFRTVLGYGSQNKRGLSGAFSVGFDVDQHQLQYDSAQVSYNWDCCGINMEYRRFELGTAQTTTGATTPIRDESQFRFTFSLSNIGAFGNLRGGERLY